MITFLFWNINKKPLEKVIADLAEEHNIDVLILAECEIKVATMLNELNRGQGAQFDFPFSQCEKIVIYTRFPGEFLKPVFESARLTIRRLVLIGREEILLAAVHLPDRMNFKEKSHISECIELGRTIREMEEAIGHTKTVLVGDLNGNPFDYGVIAANGLQAVMTKGLALKKARTVQGKRYQFFYNPMWNYFGDATEGPAGTYYYEKAEHDIYFWNIFDQVLLRPDMLSFFSNDDLKILTKSCDESLLSAKGLPDKKHGSDHLPILFRLSL
jgi:endonuclease/exonuclease/phosphatase (EEP) superfamily protein YafD